MPLTAALPKGGEKIRLIHGMDLSVFPFLLSHFFSFSALLYLGVAWLDTVLE